MKQIHYSDNSTFLPSIKDGSINLIYIDPPFNTGIVQQRARNTLAYVDRHTDYIAFCRKFLKHAHRVLHEHGSLLFHIDYHESHYVKILLDELFGRNNFQNEIIWAYDFGGRSKKRWPAKHDTIFWYTKHPTIYTFNYSAIDRVPYLAPGLAGPEKTKIGKVPTDVWWQTIVSGNEKTGYPTQKPMAILERIIKVHSNKNDLVLDFFAGSGTTGEACEKHSRKYILVDNNKDAIDIMAKRLPNATIHKPV